MLSSNFSIEKLQEQKLFLRDWVPSFLGPHWLDIKVPENMGTFPPASLHYDLLEAPSIRQKTSAFILHLRSKSWGFTPPGPRHTSSPCPRWDGEECVIWRGRSPERDHLCCYWVTLSRRTWPLCATGEGGWRSWGWGIQAPQDGHTPSFHQRAIREHLWAENIKDLKGN